jgi:hypothetical protein
MIKKMIFLAALTAGGAAASPIDWQIYQGPAAGARAAALSGTMVADDSDPSLVFWNPAGLAGMKWTMATCSYLHSQGLIFDPVFSGPKRLNYLAFAGRGMGMSWRSIARKSGTTLETEGADTVSRYLKYGVDEFTLALGKQDELHPSMSLGVALKLLVARMTEVIQPRADTLWGPAMITDETGAGYGLDLGFHGNYQPFLIGITVQNLAGKVYWKEFDDDRLKPKISAGFAWHNGKLPRITASAERFWGQGVPEIKYMVGGEYKHSMPGYGALVARGGFSQYQKSPEGQYDWSAGLGYVYKKIMVDASVVDQTSGEGEPRQKTYLATLSLFLE